MSKFICKIYVIIACSLISLDSFGEDSCLRKLRALICCEKKPKNNENSNTNNTISNTDLNINSPQRNILINKKIAKYYDLSKKIDLNSIDLEDLENIFKQVLFERIYNFMQKSHIINIIEDKKNKECEDNNIDQKKKWWKAKEIFEKLLLEYKKKGVELEKDLTNERDGIVFKNIKRLNPEKFNKIQDDYIKLIASFFLSDKDYENYIKEMVTQQKQELLQNNDNENNTSKKEIEKFFDENYDESFLKYLGDYTISHGFYDDKDFNTKLNQCIPYKPSSMTYRGTGPLNLDYKKPFDMEWNSKENVVEWFIQKIKDRVWQEEGFKSYSLDPAVAAYFAIGWDINGGYRTHVNFRILIRNYYNKTGVELKPLLTKAGKEEKEGVYLSDRYEEEILYPLNSKFKILGIHLSPENTYDINWRSFSEKKDRGVFSQFFIVLDVVQIE